ncbi:MAG: hypothetical protein KKH68_14430 [Proteobacteria bacterium]|nr:hypothetical protein [Pseudomonadota bacterium]
MEVEKILEKYGFAASSSCSGFEWYTKRIKFRQKDAFITITDVGGTSLPESLDKPVLVDIIDLNSGDQLEASRRFESLKSYLDTLSPE